MRDPRAVCLSCVLRQLAHYPSHPPPLPPLLILRQYRPSARSRSRPATGLHDDVPSPRGRASFSKLSGGHQPSRPAWASLISSATPPPPPRSSAASLSPGKTKRQGRTGSGNEYGRNTIALFEEIVNDQKEIHDQHQDEPCTSPDAGMSMSEALAGLDTDLYGDITAFEMTLKTADWDSEDVISTILDKLMPRLLRSNVESVKILKPIVREVLDSIVRIKCDYVAEQPTATRIALVHSALGIPMTKNVSELILSLIQEFLSIATYEIDTLSEHETALGMRESILNDILGAWRVLCYPHHLMAILLSRRREGIPISIQPPDEFHFPDLSGRSYASYQRAEAHDMDKALLKLFPQVYTPGARRKLRPAIIATYALLTDPACRNRQIEMEASDFIRVVGRALGSGRLGTDYVKSVIGEYPELQGYVLERWNSLSLPSTSDSPIPGPITMVGGQAGHISLDAAYLLGQDHRHLSKALELKNLDEASQRWDLFKATQQPVGPGQAPESLRSQFDYFVYVFMALRSPEMAMTVWNHMISLNIKPSVKTWTAMLQGCKYTGKAAAIENVWRKLVLSGIDPDQHAWTARISGLASCGAHREALFALDEIFDLWEASDRQDSKIKPTIAQFNAVLSALAGSNKIDETQKLIEWAKQKGLTPDIYTYNVLLRIAVRHGNPGDVPKVLEEMTAAGVAANEATITIVFGDLLNEELIDTPEEQSKKVMGLLDQMEKRGMKPNKETYGKVIHLLLKRGADGEQVVKAVLSRLSASGLTRSPHIYAMLADYYFTRMPADVRAVESLITTHELGIDRPLRADRVFWERIIKGYADCGLVDKALKVWNDLVNAPGTSALEVPVTLNVAATLLKALVLRGDAENAQNIVLVIEKWASEHRATNTLGHRRFWKHNFWHHARRHGLLKGEGQPLLERTAQQVKRR